MTLPTLSGIATTRDRTGGDRRFLGHPGGLSTLFFVELWERFSYYGMRAILLYYLVDTANNGGLGIDRGTGAAIVATYGASVYLLGIVGGFVADRLVGPLRSTLAGSVVIMAGHLSLAVPMTALSWLGIALVALGTGLLKPNISTMVGQLYRPDDPRRDGGFQLFYMSINIGALAAPFVVGFLRGRWGYHAGFSAAAVGMGVALACFVLGASRLDAAARRVPNPLPPAARAQVPLLAAAAVALAAFLYAIAGLWRDDVPDRVMDTVSLLAVGAASAYFLVMSRSAKVSDVERRHLRAYLPLFVGGVLFWMLFEQASGKMALFAADNTDLHAGPVAIDPEWYQSVNPAAVIVLAGFFGWLWTRRAGRFPSTPMKFVLGVAIIGLSAFLLAWGFATYGAGQAPFLFLGAVFVVQTVAELCLSPVGIGATTVLAPRAFASQVMALWFLTSAVGQSVAAQSIVLMKDLSDARYYATLGTITLAFAGILLALVPWTRRQMLDVEEQRRAAASAARRGDGPSVPPSAA